MTGPAAPVPSLPAEGAGPGPVAGSSAAATPGPVRRRHRRWWVAATAAALAVGVVVALFATGVVAWGRAAAVPGIPFSRARSESYSAATADLGGTWAAAGAIGVDVRLPTSVPTADVSKFLGSNCTVEALPGQKLPSQLFVPEFGGPFASGLSPFWIVVLSEATTGALTLVEVLNATATPVAQVGGTGCAQTGLLAQPLPATTVDSPHVATIAWSAAGQFFVSDNPSLTTLVMAVFGGGSYLGVSFSSAWAIVYAPCDPLLGGSTAEHSDAAILNITNGGFMYSDSNIATDCPS